MRSVFFQRPLEYQIEVDGETWNQGEMIEGRLRIRNTGEESIFVNTTQLLLAYALKKTVKEGAATAWDVLETQVLAQDILLSAGEDQLYKWNFQLPTDCPITDKHGGLFLLFGGAEVFVSGGRLDLHVNLHPILQNFLQTFTTQFRFLEKYRKRKKEVTEVKLVPPESREFPNMEHLICYLRIHNEQLEAHYRFKMKGLGRRGEQMKVTKKNREIEQSIPPENYLLPGNFPNRACFRENINEALKITRPEVMF